MGLLVLRKRRYYNDSSLEIITIPSSVKTIGESAFESSELTDITFSPNSSLTKIGDYAFYDCCSVENITISSSVTTIGHDAFDPSVDVIYTK
jgi:hypothetical protein